MPDLRYHLISLISVFLALAIGILLGVAMADRGVVSDRLQAEITGIQRQFDRQQRESVRQERRIAEQELMLERMSEAMIARSLEGEDVALVAGPYADTDLSRAVEADLSEAGASITAFETLPAPPPSPLEATAPEKTSAGSATRLRASYASTARKILGYTGEVEDPPEVVIFVGGIQSPHEAPPGALTALGAAEREMFRVWLDAGVRVVAGESSNAGRSEVRLFQNVGIPSVDYADEPAGRAALVRLAATDVEGSYGLKDTASEPFPPPR